MKKTIVVLLSCVLASSGYSDTGKLTLDRALDLARIHSPELKAARLQTRAAEQAVLASGRWQNPLINIKSEGIGWDLDGVSSAETEIMLRQTFLRGGKRDHDRAVAQKSISIASQQEAEKEMVLLAQVRLAFIEVLSLQETDAVRSEQEQLGRAFVDVAERKRQAGGGSELEVVQAELALQEIILSQTCCLGDLKAARIRLASLMGIAAESMPELEGDYFLLETLDASKISDTHPALMSSSARIDVLHSQAARAKARDAVDITVGAGYKYEAAENVNTLVAAASIPLNFVRAGSAEQASILTQVEALYAGRDELRRQLQQELSMLIAVYNGAKIEAEMTRDNLMPIAEKAYELSKTGYEAGRFSWFELINAQHHLADIRVRHIEALRDAHIARAKIYRFMMEDG